MRSTQVRGIPPTHLVEHVELYTYTHGHVDLRIVADQYKVFPGTERKIYTDQFFQSQNIVVNALDNVEARRYVDKYVC